MTKPASRKEREMLKPLNRLVAVLLVAAVTAALWWLWA